MRPELALLLLAGTACSDYDLMRGDKSPTKGAEDTASPEPTEDPDIAVSPTSIDFGGLPKDCAAEPQAFTISNEGLGDLEVTNIEVTGSGYSAFETDWDGQPFTLAYGESATFHAGFTPNAWTDYSVAVSVESNDPDEPTVQVDLTGFGAEDTTYEQTFVQDFFEEVDVLWVVDNSGSMSDNLVTVTQNFESFITVFTDLGLDYHMAVITTDMDDPSDSGRFQGEVITNETADPIGEFLAQVDQGSEGSATEKGFEAIYTALTEPLISTTNAGFLREEAALGAIVISDEDDSSWMGPSDFVDWFEGLKPSDDMTTFSAICDDLFISCYQYQEAADLTGGMTGDIAQTSYIEVLEQISMTTAGLLVSIDLDEEPSDVSRIVVTVNGSEVPDDSENGWTYDTLDNAIVFHGSAIPEAGDTGTISYPVASTCD